MFSLFFCLQVETTSFRQTCLMQIVSKHNGVTIDEWARLRLTRLRHIKKCQEIIIFLNSD